MPLTIPLHVVSFRTGADAVSYVVGHADVAAICCSSAVLSTVLEVAQDAPSLKVVVGGDGGGEGAFADRFQAAHV